MKLFDKLFGKNDTGHVDTMYHDDIMGDQEITAVKPSKPKNETNFMDGFDMKTHSSVDKKIEKSQTEGIVTVKKKLTYDAVQDPSFDTPKKVASKLESMNNEQKKEILKNSLIIMIDKPIDSDQLEFIGKSRINGRPIYRYIGKDFLKFRSNHAYREFEEVFYQPGYGIK